MITKGIILSRNVNSNTYSVRIPYFEVPGSFGVGTASRSVFDATLSHVPGISESYKANDVVFIGFEDHLSSKPVILGKLYVDGGGEYGRGSYSVNSMTVASYASLPENTTIGGVDLSTILEYMRRTVNLSDAKQDTLVSGTNIRTVNGNSLLDMSGGTDLELFATTDVTPDY